MEAQGPAQKGDFKGQSPKAAVLGKSAVPYGVPPLGASAGGSDAEGPALWSNGGSAAGATDLHQHAPCC